MWWFSSFKRCLGDGTLICFWKDLWVGNCSLKERFPRLYYLETRKEAKVCEMGSLRGDGWGWNWVWSRAPRGRALQELGDLQTLLHNVFPSLNRRDNWLWSINAHGVCSFKALKTKPDEIVWDVSLPGGSGVTHWNNLIPRKVCIFAWRAKHYRLPVRIALDNHGIDLNSTLCPWCVNEIECIDHCLVSCSLLESVWVDIFKWWGWESFRACSARDLLCHQGHALFKHSSCRTWKAVLWAACYLIWLNRKNKVFRQKGLSHQNLVELIKSPCFDWVSRRCRRGSLIWEKWLRDPVEATKLIS